MKIPFILIAIAVLSLAAHGEVIHTHDAGLSGYEARFAFANTVIAFGFTLMLIIGIVVFFAQFQGKDLLEFSIVRRLMKNRLYPKIVQLPTLVFFCFIVYFFFWGPLSYGRNPGSVLAWTLWWPLVPLTFVLLGRLWCMACPLPLFGDVIQKFIHPTRKPGAFLMKYGIWIMDGIFIAITLFDRLYGMVDTPWLSGAVFALILLGVLVISVRYERRAFCKHICFLGGVSGNYSMLAGLSVESKDKQVCAECRTKACYFGSGTSAACPYSNVIQSKDSMRNCTLCANCIKSCPKDNVALRIRGIASELWSHARVSFSESFFAKLMVGIVIIQNLGMLAVWGDLQGALERHGLHAKLAIAVLYFGAIAAPLALMTLSSAISSRLQTQPSSTVQNFAAFGYAFIPIDVAGHIAHNAFHLLAEGKSILGAFTGLLTGEVASSGAVASSPFIKGLQFGLIAAGSIGTLWVAYKISAARETGKTAAFKVLLPHAVLLCIIIAVNVWLFAASMGFRGGNA
ncbi:4Fe-4S binding protein [Candidatus Woesearchaeota archaeon]|nr:4Fe-4S binding protein [Candidatus Woesearchaeota archaeon]